MDTIASALRRLELNTGAQAVYLSLLQSGRATARVLADRTRLTRPSVYDQLKRLRELGLVVELEYDGKKQFAASDVKYLDALLEDKIDRITQSRQFLTDALPTIQGTIDTVTPKIRFFEGEEGMKQLMKDVMWYDKITLTTIWNHDTMKARYDETFLRWWNERRILRQIKIIWRAKAAGRRGNNNGVLSKKVQRVAADKVSATLTYFCPDLDTVSNCVTAPSLPMTMFIYGNKVACVSSPNEAYGFIVESAEFVNLQRSLFS